MVTGGFMSGNATEAESATRGGGPEPQGLSSVADDPILDDGVP